MTQKHHMDLERSGTFIIRINPAGGRRTAQKDPLSKTTDTGHISANQSKSFEWSDLTGRVVVKAWPGNIPRDARDGLRITAGWPVVVDDRLTGHLISEPPYYKPGGLYKPATTSLPLRKGQRKRTARHLHDTADGHRRRLDKKNLDKLISKHVENAFNNPKPPAAISGTGATNPSLIERQAAYRELIAAREDNPVFSIVDRDRLINAVNRLPTMNTYVALQVHGL